MDANGGGDGSRAFMSRVEIDASPPFRSVKEAVLLFGDKELAGRVGGEDDNLVDAEHTMRQSRRPEQYGSPKAESSRRVAAELEETKQILEKAKEESMMMANTLFSLKEELERTKKELEDLQRRNQMIKQVVVPAEIKDLEEDVKFVEVSPAAATAGKKKTVTFTHPTLSDIIVPSGVAECGMYQPELDLERESSLKKKQQNKKKKKPLVPLFGALFPKMKTDKYHHI